MTPGIDVCICTYRRASVVETLRAVAGQQDLRMPVRVIVADNDGTPSARAVVMGAKAELKLDITYIHAPARNISVARNACLEASSAPLLAFIDDDLAPSPLWLSTLLRTQETTNADVVFGPVRAHYPDGAPAWACAADLHSTLPTILADRSIATGYTCNALIRRGAMGDLRFDPNLGRSGGEDTVFFFEMSRAGARLAYAHDAVVDEAVDPARIKLSWLLKRSFRAGQTHARVLRMKGARPSRVIPALLMKISYCVGASALSCLSPAGWRRSAVRGALHAGTLLGMSGVRDLELY